MIVNFFGRKVLVTSLQRGEESKSEDLGLFADVTVSLADI